MADTLITLLGRARAAGIALSRHPDGGLRIQAPATAAPIAKALRARQDDVLPLLGALQQNPVVLNWRDAWLADDPAPCVICRRPALLRDPHDNRPMHKVCAEQLLTEATTRRAAA